MGNEEILRMLQKAREACNVRPVGFYSASQHVQDANATR